MMIRWKVLILVVMDDPLRALNGGQTAEFTGNVLILVVMDDPLRDQQRFVQKQEWTRLNPCCNG